MKILTLIMILALAAAPCQAAFPQFLSDTVMVASAGDGQEDTSSGGKIIIKGKGGKVTDVEQKPKKKKKKKGEDRDS